MKHGIPSQVLLYPCVAMVLLTGCGGQDVAGGGGGGGGDTPQAHVAFSSAGREVLESGGSVTIGVVLDRAATVPVTVELGADAAPDPSRYQLATTTVVIPAGALAGSVEVDVVDDGVPGPTETITLDLVSATGAGVGDPATFVLTIDDDDTAQPPPPPPPATPVLAIAGAQATEASGSLAFQVTLSAAAAQPVTVQYATRDGSAHAGADYVAASGELAFAAGETSKTIDVGLVEDGLYEGDEDLYVDLASPVGADLGQASARGVVQDSDAMPTLSIAGAEASEGDGHMVFTVTLSAASGLAASAAYATRAGSATSGEDFAPTTGTVTFAAGATTATIEVPVEQDSVYELDQDFWVDLGAIAGATAGNTSARGVIHDDDPAPTLTVADASAFEADGDLAFLATLSAPSEVPASATWTTRGIEATSDVDFESATGTLEIPAGETSTTIHVTVLDDSLYELTERMALDLGGESGCVLAATSAEGTILDDDTAPTLSIADAEAGEGDGTMTFTVSLSGPSGAPAGAAFATRDGSARAPGDYGTVTGTVVIAAGDTSATIVVPVVQDTVYELDQDFYVDLGVPSGATGVRTTGRGVIHDDDPAPQLTVADASTLEADGDLAFVATLSPASEVAASVAWTPHGVEALSEAGVDFAADGGTLTIPAGDTTGTIHVTVYDDSLYELTEHVVIDLGSETGCTLGTTTATGSIVDDDTPPTISIADAEAGEADGTMTFTVSLSGSSGAPASAGYQSRDGSAREPDDYGAVSGTVSIAAGATSASIVVPIVQDTIYELDQDFHVDLGAPSGATGGTLTARGVIHDDDAQPSVTVADTSAHESDGTMTFTLVLSPASEVASSVAFATRDGTATAGADYEAQSGTATFAAGDTLWSITVPIDPDLLYEGDESLHLDLSLASELTIARASALGTILDDDPPPTVQMVDATRNAVESAGVVTISASVYPVSGLDVTVPFTLDGSSTATLGADLTTPGADFTLSASPLVIPAGQTSASITVTLVDDTTVEPNETVVLDLGTPQNATLGATARTVLTIIDNDGVQPLTLVDAMTLDSDGDGFIDGYKLTFSRPVVDSSFPGYVANGLGTGQTQFVVDGFTGVVLAQGTAAPEADTPNDQVLYLSFAEHATPDTAATPDVTTAGAPTLATSDGAVLTPVASGDVTERDGAGPALVAATTESGLGTVYLFFSEPVHTTGACPGGTVAAADLVYTNVSGGGVTGLADGTDANGCDREIAVATVGGNVTAGDIGADTVAPAAGLLFDDAGNAASTRAVKLSGVVHPYVLDVVSTAVDGLRIDFSEAVDPVAATSPDSYGFTQTCSGTTTAASLGGGVALTASSFAFTTAPQSPSCIYTLTALASIHDLDEDAAMGDPAFGTFQGNQALHVLGAAARTLVSFVIDFSKPVRDTGAGGADNAGYYTIPSTLGTVVSAIRYDKVTTDPADASRVLVTHSVQQGGAFYSVIVSTALASASGTEMLLPNPYDRTTFQGLAGEVTSVDQGALFTDPFGDGSTFSFVFNYGGKVYAGPNDNNDAVFRFDPDGANPVTVTFRTKSATPGAPFATFGKAISRPAQTVSTTGTTARYYVTPGTDLSAMKVGNPVAVTLCTNAGNNVAGTVAALDDALDFVDVASTTAVAATGETCMVEVNNNAGPSEYDGVDAFVTATVAGAPYLVFGGHSDVGNGFQELEFTRDTDTVLDNDYCSIGNVTLGNTQSLQTVYGYGNYLYIAFASNQAAQPILASLQLGATGTTCAALNNQVTSSGTKQAREIAYLGPGGSPKNTATSIGIDSIVVHDNGTTGPALYIANNGGIARTTALPPTSSTTWTNVRHNGDGVWAGTTRAIPHIGKLRPGQKGVPFMVEWGGPLFVARNRGDVPNAELWRYSGASTWTKLIDTTSSAGGMSTGNQAISLVVVSGGRLYVGFDDATGGAELWRTKDGVTAASVASVADFEKVGLSGLGPEGATAFDLVRNKYIVSSTSIAYGGKSYLYVTVGCDTDFTDNGVCDRDARTGYTDFAIRMFRQVD